MFCYRDKIIQSLGSVLLVLVISSVGVGQERWNVKWGQVPAEDLKLTSLPEDPEADGVILFERCDMSITLEFNLIIKIQRRIKILTESGKKYADVSIDYWHEDKIDKLDAQTILPDGKKIGLDKKKIFERKNGLWKEKVFAFPGVEVGAILEYRYEKFTEHLTTLEPWYFQNEEFTRCSEVSVTIPMGFEYNVFFCNVVGGDPQPIREEIFNPLYSNGRATNFTWRQENLPAIKPEPYMTTLNDYLTAIHFQLTSYRDHYQYYVFIKSWDDLAQKVWEEYKDKVLENQGMEEVAAKCCEGIQEDQEKVKALYNYVRDEIETLKYQGLFSIELRFPRQIIKSKNGSAVEKNLLLINLLRKVGLAAYPVLISTRSHGRFYDRRIQLQQFNHVLACVTLGSQKLYLDTDDRYCPFGLLPLEDLVERGLLVTETKGEIIQIPAPKGVNMNHALTHARLTKEGELICESIVRYEGYRGIEARNELSDKGEDEYVKTLLEEKFGKIQQDSFKIENMEDAELPLTIRINYRLQDHAQMTGDMVYVSPVLLHSYQSNPFKRENRNYPVDFSYRRAAVEELELSVPEGFKIIELPRQTNYQSTGLRFACSCEIENNIIRFQRHLMLMKSIFAPHEYPELRNVYERLVSTGQGQVVLSQTPETADAK